MRSPAGRQPGDAGRHRAGGPVFGPLDEVRGWWRYHHLFADLLRARLQAEQPGRVQALHRAAAAWCEEHDLADDAVRHALAAGEAAWAARLVERHVEELLGRSEGVTLRRWLSALPAESDAPVRACAWPRRTPSPRGSSWKHSRPCSMTPSAPLRSAATNHMNSPSDRHKAIACWPMPPPASRSCAPRSRGFAVMPPARPATTGRPWPTWARTTGSCAPSCTGTGRRRTGWTAGSGQPSAAWQRCSPAAGRRRALRWLSPYARLVRPGRGAARPGQLGCGTGDLPASAGHLRREQPDGPHGSGARGSGPGLVRAERADRRP